MRLLGIGLDLVSVGRIERALERYGDRLRYRLLGPGEREELAGRGLEADREAQYLAGRWAAKEAAAKALGTGLAALGWRNIAISSSAGRPTCTFLGSAAQLAASLGVLEILLTITHEGGVAAACAVAMGTPAPGSRGGGAQ